MLGLTCFGLSPEVLEGLGSSGRLIGSISTDPGTYKYSWSRVMAKNPGGDKFFTVHGMGLCFSFLFFVDTFKLHGGKTSGAVSYTL